ncbi:hypothetical protein [Bradyrhizobium sp.]|uniref:hypothetical protein n=1 Tax=Bradyrhizobium sp. TaxID=376 RepID=UPI0025C21D19|nr:hypothetical protein [Bradyrhizobium sp.]
MNNNLLSCLIAGALGTTLALASPALAFHGGGAGMGGGMHAGGGMGGGMAVGGMSAGARFGAMGGSPALSGGRTTFSGGRTGTAFTRAGLAPRSSAFAFRDRDHDHFGHHRFHGFAFVGVPYDYAAYDSCWRRVWTPYGLTWVDVCNDYGY